METIVTHNGRFHADEVMGCAVMQKLFPKSTIVRTRNPDLIEKGSFVIDIGGEYDPDNNRFDHHQYTSRTNMDDLSGEKPPTFLPQITTPMSSIGMVFKKYGEKLISLCAEENCIILNKKNLSQIIKIIYMEIIEEIDGIDNGVGDPSKTSLSVIIAKMNTDSVYDDKLQRIAFDKACIVCYYALEGFIISVLTKFAAIPEDIKTIARCFANKSLYDEKKRILVLDRDCPNWLYCLRKHEKGDDTTKFVMYRADGNSWIARGVNNAERYSVRHHLLHKDQYPFEGVNFVHSNRFIGGGGSFDTTLQMVKFSLEHPHN